MRLFAILLIMFQGVSFKETQLQHIRVKHAYAEKEDIVKQYLNTQRVSYNDFEIFIRGFKYERVLEVWVRQKNENMFSLLHTYNFCASSGELGPKRREGDLQIPEGVYSINHFNPESNFHLSLGLNYPNASDKILSTSSIQVVQFIFMGTV